jgi:hypothetical protein
MDEDKPEGTELRGLYREPPERFIGARDALERRLREAGRAGAAGSVKKLRKPTVSAWALDQLVERDPEGVEALLAAGGEVRSAQQAALSSPRGADRLREATASRREVVSRLARLAASILRDSGRSPDPHLDDIRVSLESASVDEEAGARLRAGTLEHPLREPSGFGNVFGLHSVAAGEEEATVPPGRATEESVSSAELRRLRRDLEVAERTARQARESAGMLAEQVSAAESRLKDLREKHAAAETRALEVELEAKRAEEALRRVSTR